jgi:small GTP-binding protein
MSDDSRDDVPELLPALAPAAEPDLDAGGELTEAYFSKELDAAIEERVNDFSQTLNIAVIGRVSCGKSSVINALLRRDRADQVSAVGAVSGVTTELTVLRLDDQVRIVDSPGLDDIVSDNSKVTRDFLRHVDVGIFVVTGSADAGQRRHLADLRKVCDSVFVVLNKVDEWDRHAPSARDKVIDQWKECLRIDPIYPTCAFGFDPDIGAEVPLDVRGIDELRADMEDFLVERGKDLLLARHMGQKTTYALGIIAGALASVAGEAFIPGSGIYITATQAAAISGLYYLYTGRVLSKQSALAIIPSFAARSAGASIFLAVKSFLPPTGVIDAAAAAVAVVVTFAMLMTINTMLANGHELHEQDVLRETFKDHRALARPAIAKTTPDDWRDPAFWKKVIHDVMYG